jgi:hypothetical protein
VISAALAAGVASLTASSGQRSDASSVAAEVRSVPAREAALFGVLATPRNPADSFVPVRAGTGPFGANPQLARSVRERSGGLSTGLVSVVPANGAVCLRVPVADDISQWWCQRLASAARGELLGAIRPAGRLRASNQLIVGLVPDGVHSVLIASAGGARHLVPVRRNVYDAQLYAPQRVFITLPGRGTVQYGAP